MPYVPFNEYFPEIAEEETRCLIGSNDPALPGGPCGLVEAYCDEIGCDCRRVFFNVISDEGLLAVIAYGWENDKFYARWMGDNDPMAIRHLKGPVLNMGSPQSRWAYALLEVVREVILTDQSYVERLKRHYRMFKEAIAGKTANTDKIGRNNPCSCGSGKKHKRCCLNLNSA